MSNLMSMVKLRNKPSRDGYDYSRKVAFSAKVGELLPCECIEMIPNDTATIRKQHFTRTQPVNTAAYTRMREYYDWFFVPTNLLWSSFNYFVTQMYDETNIASSLTYSHRISQLQPYFTTTQIKGYLKELQDSDDTRIKRNIFGYQRNYQSAKLLSYLGYGNYFHYCGDDNQPEIQDETVMLNPFPLLAYQKIYQDYYRNPQWEQSYAPACNVDYAKDSTAIDPRLADKNVENLMDLRYANWNKDYFMGLMPNSQYGNLATVDFQSLSTTDATPLTLLGSPNDSQLSTDSNGFLTAASSNVWKLNKLSVDTLSRAMGVTTDQLSSRFSILALRLAEASQKWKEISQSNRYDYPSQVEAHFGVRPSEALSHICQFIDGGVSQLDIDEVQNQNLADDNAATIGGKGIGTGDSHVEFKTNVHGYLMCIYHCKPILDFQIDGIKKRNLKVYATDYAIPEFDKTGMVKVPMIELNFGKLSNAWQLNPTSDFLLGYAPQYYEYKTQYDEVLGAFAHGNLSHWTAPLTRDYLKNYFDEMYYQFGRILINYLFFKIPPSVVNPIFVGQVDSEHNDLNYDQLLINCSFDIKLVRNLDRNGLPY